MDADSTSTTRVAAIDCGTNSIRLLVSDVELATGRAKDVTRELLVVRLGQGVDRTGAFTADALGRTFEACRVYASRLRALGSPPLRFAATSASRDAANREEFLAGVRAILGVEPEVISGEQEAELSFQGATSGLPPGVSAPFLVVDIGGGSTEFVLGTTGSAARSSVDIGSVRITERHLRCDPPTAQELAAATADIDAAVRHAAHSVPMAQARTLIGLAGSVTTVAAIALGLAQYDSARIHHSRIPLADVQRVTDRLAGLTAAQRVALAAMHPGRADVIVAGALILRRIMELMGAEEVLVSEHDILDGLVRSVAVRGSAAEESEAQDDPTAAGDPVAEE